MMKAKETANTIKPYHKVLYNHFMTADQPGTILRDFDTLLHIVYDSQPLKVTSSNSLLPMKMLPDINARLVNPIRLDFTRPQHKSFPNILGLFLLLRATGLAFLEGSGARSRLVIDEDVLQSWNSLNETERYFMLFETALLRANPGIIGESHHSLFDNPVYRWQHFLRDLPEDGLQIAGNPQEKDWLLSAPGMYNLTLLSMFAIITIHDAEPEPGRGWNIVSIHPTMFGAAVFQHLQDDLPDLRREFWEEHREDHSPRDAPIGELQPLFEPFFPEWRHNLELAQYENQEGVYVFKVTLWKGVWRRIAISGSLPLNRLSDAVLEAFKFVDDCHLYRFIYIDRFGIERHVDHPALYEGRRHENLPPLTDATRIQDVPLRLGTSMIFYFDFGDQWQFEMLLEEIAPPDSGMTRPKVLESHGSAPEQYGW